MRELSEMTPEEWANAKPGDRYASSLAKATDFRSFAVANSIVSKTGDVVTVIFTRSEPSSVRQILTLNAIENGEASFDASGTEIQMQQVEAAHVSMAPKIAMQLARSLLDIIGIHDPEALKALLASLPPGSAQP